MSKNFQLWALAVVLAVISSYCTDASNINSVVKSRPLECAKGSSFWCKDLRSAKRCGAVKHCIQVVWEHKKLPPDNSTICDTCKQMVQEARDVLQSNTTMELIKEVLDGTCQIYFPLKVLSHECMKYVDEFIPELVDMLASRMDPQVVCSIAWLCNSNKVAQLIEDVKLLENKPTVGDQCQDCKTFVADVVTEVKGMSQGDLETKLKAACDLLKGYVADMCSMAVKSNIGDIYNYLINLNPSDACKLASMCAPGVDRVFKNKKPQPVVVLPKPKTGDEECDFCVQLTTRLRDMLIVNSTKAEVKQTLLSICTQLKVYKDKCTAFVNDYFEEVYDFLIDEMNPQLFCAAIGLCKSGRQTSVKLTGKDEANSYETNSIDYQPKRSHINNVDKQAVKIRVPLSKGGPLVPPRPATNCEVRGKPECALCEFALHQLQQMLMQNSTEEEIKEALDKVCGLLPKSLSQQCTVFIDQYGAAILSLLAQELDPSIICTELKLCDPQVAEMYVPYQALPPKPEHGQLPLERMFPPRQQLEGKEACLECQYVMKLAQALLEINGTKEQLIIGLDNLCHELPHTYQDRCDSLVSDYAEKIIDGIQETDLSKLCNFMSFCQGNAAAALLTQATKAATEAVKHANAETCTLCEAIVEIVGKLMANPSVARDIVVAAEDVCNLIPLKSRSKCKSAIEVYGPYLVKLIESLVEPQKVCQAIEMCAMPPGHVQLLGGKKCTYGPDYWCKSKIHAKACKAEKHCRDLVWKN